MDSRNTRHHVIESRAPWQHGRMGEAGGLLNAQLALAREEMEPQDDDELELLVWMCVAARNHFATAVATVQISVCLERLIAYHAHS